MSGPIKTVIVSLTILAFIFLGGCAGSRYETVADVENHWGSPVRVEQMPDGSEKRFYPFRAEGQWEYVYFAVKDGVVIGQGGSIAGR